MPLHRRLQILASCRLYVFTASHRVNESLGHTYRQLNHLLLISNFSLLDTQTLLHAQRPRVLCSYTIDNTSLYILTLGFRSLWPFRHTTTSLSQKDFYLYRFCLLWVSHSLKSNFSQPIAIMLQCVLALTAYFNYNLLSPLLVTTKTWFHSRQCTHIQYWRYHHQICITQTTILLLVKIILCSYSIPHCKRLNDVVLLCLLLFLSSLTLGDCLIALNFNLWGLMPLPTYCFLWDCVWFCTWK